MIADCDSVMLDPPTVTPPLATGVVVGAEEEEERVGDQVGDWSTTTNREGKQRMQATFVNNNERCRGIEEMQDIVRRS